MSPSPHRILVLFGSRVMFGQERANIEVLGALRKAGCEILCVVRHEPWSELVEIQDELAKRDISWVKSPYVDYPVKGWIIHTIISAPFRYLKGNHSVSKIIKEFSPTHIHAFNQQYVSSYLEILNSSAIPLIYRCGDRPIKHNAFYRYIWKYVIKRATTFVADSDYIRKQLIDSGAPEDRVAVFHAPPPVRIHPTPFQFVDTGLHRPKIRFVYVGQIISEKGVEVAVRAFANLQGQFPSSELVIAGRISDWSGDDWARHLRDRTHKDAALREKVRFLGVVDDVPGLLAQCDVHLAPSLKQEPYGLVVVEAKAAGIPSIIFRSGGMTELINDGVDGIIVPMADTDGYQDAMMRLATDEVLRRSMGVQAAESSKAFSLEALSDFWMGVYDRAAHMAPLLTRVG